MSGFDLTPRELAHLADERRIVEQLSGDRARMHRAMNATPGEIRGLEDALAAVSAAPAQPDPVHAAMTEHVARLAATFHPGGVYPCPVTGCTWSLSVPPPELVEIPGEPRLGPAHYSWHVQYVGAPREQVELTLVLHLDAHATNGAPPATAPPEPDPWLEDDDEPEGWRIP